MFTGIVRGMARVTAIEPSGGDVSLRLQSNALPFAEYEVGESIAVNGVCLTATSLSADGFSTDVSNETLAVTTLGDLRVGSTVNIEPSLSLGDRLGGHLVSGHVDCVGELVERYDDARSIRLAIRLPAAFSRYVARKGSVCVDGVSLTINAVSGDQFELNIIPHTAETTIIGDYVPGTRVNIEVDLLARYVERLLAKDEGGLTEEFLREHGYV